MMSNIIFNQFISIIFIALVIQSAGIAAESIDDILEKARAKAQEIEKLKKVLNEETDQNVRLAAFNLMIANGDTTMHEIAVESGLGSADKLLQEAAFKEAIMSLESLHIKLQPDAQASKESQKSGKDYIEKYGDVYVLKFDKKDSTTGTIAIRGGMAEIIGTHFSYSTISDKGTLYLKDGNTLEGELILRNKLKFSGSSKIR